MGRPSKLTPAVQKKIIEAIRNGNYYNAACAYAGIQYQTFWEWMKRGEKAKSGKHFQFFQEVKKAEAEAEARIVALWQSKIPKDWRAAQVFLERRYPDRWSRKEKVEVEGGSVVNIQVNKKYEK